MKIGLVIYTSIQGWLQNFWGPMQNKNVRSSKKKSLKKKKVGKKFFPFFHNLALDLSWCFYFLYNTAICLVGGYSRSKYRPSQAPKHPILWLGVHTYIQAGLKSWVPTPATCKMPLESEPASPLPIGLLPQLPVDKWPYPHPQQGIATAAPGARSKLASTKLLIQALWF